MGVAFLLYLSKRIWLLAEPVVVSVFECIILPVVEQMW